MGKMNWKIFLCVVFFPITIAFFILKWLLRRLQNIYLKRYISSITIDSIDSLSGEEFEDLLYYYFSSIGFKVKKTKKSHDYGADLIILGKTKKIVIQCKLYYNHSVGNSAIQEIFTATNYYNAEKGLVITNSYFSKPAINLAESSGIILWNRNTLEKILHLNNNDKKLLKSNLLSM